MEIKHFGYPGHLIVSNSCRFHLATLVGKYLVSTVGAYYRHDSKKMEEIGLNRKFETMVFLAGKVCALGDCRCGLPDITGEGLDAVGYNTAGEAQIGHEKMIKKWQKKQGAD